MIRAKERHNLGHADLDVSRYDEAPDTRTSSKSRSILGKAVIIAAACVILYGSYSILADRVLLLARARSSVLPESLHAQDCSTSTTTVPQYFQTSPELWAGPTATGRAPFLAQTNPISFEPTATFVPTNPLEYVDCF